MGGKGGSCKRPASRCIEIQLNNYRDTAESSFHRAGRRVCNSKNAFSQLGDDTKDAGATCRVPRLLSEDRREATKRQMAVHDIGDESNTESSNVECDARYHSSL